MDTITLVAVSAIVLIAVFVFNRVMRGGSAKPVDPIAEAEVYLAYGRPQQAQAILEEALKKEPGNSAIAAKLQTIRNQQ